MILTETNLLETTLEFLSKKIQIYKITDDVTSFKHRASLASIFEEKERDLPKEGCWYVLYSHRLSPARQKFFESSYVLAISKENGSILFDGCNFDEG